MLVEPFIIVYEKDLIKLKEEVSLYADTASLWRVEKGFSNSGGTLALHLLGNLNHFFGAIMGKTGYQRNRDMEFSARNISKETIMTEIDACVKMLKETLGKLSDAEVQMEYPIEFLGEKRTVIFMLAYLSSHLSYHLGQINYHRRLLN